MARLSYQETPDVAPSLEGPVPFQHIDANANAFGGAVAEGLSDVGQGALNAAKFYGQVAADNATNNTLEQANKVLHGDPGKMVAGPDGQMAPDTGYFGKKGADAMSARQEASEQIDEIIANNREHLSPLAHLQYDNETRRYRAQWLSQMGTHADEQQTVWAKETNNTGATIQKGRIGQNYTDDATFADASQKLRGFTVRNAQLLYGSTPEVANGAVLHADQEAVVTRIHAALGNNDGASAQKYLDANRAILASLPDYDTLNHQVQAGVVNQTMVPAVNEFVTGVVAGAQGKVGTAPAGVSDSIGTQEWNGKGAAPTSIDGAVGPSQIKPSTAREYGLDPSQLHDPAYAKYARDTIVSKISALPNVQGDPARIAVGYFSGAGNIAPLDSPTPWIHDKEDGNHKHVSSYVADVTGRMQRYPTSADALNASKTDIYDRAQTRAQELFPNNPAAQDEFTSHVMRRVDMQVTQLDEAARVDSHIVESRVAATNAISMDQLRSDPQTASALDRMIYENPGAYMGLERRLDANAHGAAINFGGQFSTFMDRVLRDPKDPSAITRPDQLNNFVGHGKNAFITNTGINTLSDLMKLNQGPQGHAQAAQIRQFMQQMHGQLTFTNPAAGLVDPKGEDKYAQFASQAIPALIAAAKGGNLAKVLTPGSPDYLGNLAVPFMRSQSEIMTDQISHSFTPPPALTGKTTVGQALEGETPERQKSLIQGWVRSGQLSYSDGAGLLRARGLAGSAQPAPVDPLASTPAPMQR